MKKKIKGGNRLFHFKRWSRKPWGAFASLRRLKIGVLSVSMGMIALGPKSAHAQSDTLRAAHTIELEALSVTAEKLNPTRGVVTPAAVYDRDTLSAAPLQTIESALRLNPAIDLRERGAKGAQADISLRGGTYDQTMVLLNGINFTDARTGHQSHSIPVDLETVGTIDIISGLTGIGAYTGALNFVTTPLKPEYLRTEITGGQYGYLYSNISGAVRRDGFGIMGAASFRRTDGYTANTDFNNLNFFTRANIFGGKAGLFDMQAGYQRRDFGSNGFYSLAYPDQFEHTETMLGSVRWALDAGRFSVEANAGYRRNNDRYELYRGGVNAPPDYKGPNYHTTDNLGAELGAEYGWRWGKSSIGTDYTFNHIYSNVLGEEMDSPKKIPGAEAYFTKEKSRSIVNAWVSHAARIGRARLSGSFNFAHSPYGSFPSWSAAAGYDAGRHFSVEASTTRSMRLPTFTDLYYNTSTHIGNSALKPEKAYTHQLRADYSGKGFSAGIVAYFRSGSDVIDWVKESAGDKWRADQITSLDTFGTEAAVSYNTAGFLRSVSVSYGHIKMNKESNGYISKYALDYMKNKVAVRGSMAFLKRFIFDISAAWYDRNGNYEIIRGEPLAYKPYWLLDARLSWRKGMLTAYADATNILDREYFDFGGLVQAPRWMNLGIIITI